MNKYDPSVNVWSFSENGEFTITCWKLWGKWWCAWGWKGVSIVKQTYLDFKRVLRKDWFWGTKHCLFTIVTSSKTKWMSKNQTCPLKKECSPKEMKKWRNTTNNNRENGCIIIVTNRKKDSLTHLKMREVEYQRFGLMTCSMTIVTDPLIDSQFFVPHLWENTSTTTSHPGRRPMPQLSSWTAVSVGFFRILPDFFPWSFRNLALAPYKHRRLYHGARLCPHNAYQPRQFMGLRRMIHDDIPYISHKWRFPSMGVPPTGRFMRENPNPKWMI